MELEWPRKKLPPSAEGLRPLIEPGQPRLSIRRQPGPVLSPPAGFRPCLRGRTNWPSRMMTMR
jgi:hypothetical protein